MSQPTLIASAAVLLVRDIDDYSVGFGQIVDENRL